MINLKKYIISVFGAILFCSVTPSQAAELYLNPAHTSVRPGDIFSVDIRLNSENQEINAIEGQLFYPNNLTISSVVTGQSIINFWINPPTPVASSKPGYKAVSFSGLTPGGITTSNGLIATITLKAPTSTSQKEFFVSLSDAKVLLNDGAGTATTLALKNITLSLSPLAPVESAVAAESVDTLPPESFSVAIVRNPSLFNNQWFAAFVTTDKQSGIDHYEIQESANPTPDPNSWLLAKNPTLLKDQNRKSYVFVKAVDRAGQFQITLVPPPKEKNSYSKTIFWCILLLTFSALFVRIFAFWRRQQKHVEPPT